MLRTRRRRNAGQLGSSMVELLIGVAVLSILSGISIPMWTNSQRSYRLMNDARTIADQLSVARTRAASDFTQVRVNFNLASGTYQLQLWNKTTNSFDITEGGTQFLSNTNNFSFGSVTAPAGSQTSIQESAQIIFNSRGVAVDSTGAATGNYAIYLSNNGQYSAVTVSSSGKVSVWRWTGTNWHAY